MNELLFEPHISAQYDLYRHEGYWSRIGSLDCKTKEYKDVLVFGKRAVINHAKQWNGKRNVFLSRAFRNADGSIAGCNVISFDVDPIRQKGDAATDEQHRQAIECGSRIISTYPEGYIASSGNGCLLIYYVGNRISNWTLHYRKEKVLVDELQLIAKQYNCKIDSTNYESAVTKSLGTFSTKGRNELRRCSRFIQIPIQPYRISERLLERLDNIIPPEQISTETIDTSNLISVFENDRSKADFHLVNYLHKSGVNAKDTLKLLQVNPLGRGNERPDDQARLISKIYGVEKSAFKESSNYFEGLFRKDENRKESIITGLRSLDILIGPLPKAELTTFSARSGFGKTTFACTSAEYWRKLGKRVLFFSTEMSEEYIMHKLLAIAKDIPLTKLVNKEISEFCKKIEEYKQSFESQPIIICDEFMPSIELVKTKIKEVEPDIVIFDHASQSATHWEKIAQFVRDLKETVREQGCVGLMLSMLNEPPRGKDGTVSQSIRGDVRGSQEIIFLSAIYMLVNNPYEVKNNFQPVTLTVCKNRFGLSNVSCELIVNKEISRYEDSKHE